MASPLAKIPILELPPRARRIPRAGRKSQPALGTTSACAENTPKCWTWRCWTGNYLRVRGEYCKDCVKNDDWVELPPRARRIPWAPWLLLVSRGTTSACAENTGPPTGRETPGRNYLRVRGEYLPRSPDWWGPRELPPRARRILVSEEPIGAGFGTTSACAENTTVAFRRRLHVGNYLRVRGEYYRILEMPTDLPGTTSACAENTYRL